MNTDTVDPQPNARAPHEHLLVRVQSAALEAAANGIMITGADGTIQWVNEAFSRLTGYRRDEAIGRKPSILKSGRHDAHFYQDLWATITRGHVWRGHMVNRRKDGTIYEEEAVITPVPDARGALRHFVAIKEDVTAARRAEEALRRSETHFRSLIEHALDMIFVLDDAGIIRYASPSVERVIGYRPEDILGASGFTLINPDDVGAVAALFASGIEQPDFTASAEYRVRHKDGTWRTIEAIGRNLLEDPIVRGVVINARDISDRKAADEARRRLEAQLSQTEKLAAMGNLLAGVAHELNNPLAVVIGHATLLEGTARGCPSEPRAAKIREAAERCARIVKNFLALARQYPPERTRIGLCGLVRDTLEMMAYPLRVDQVEVVLDLADDVPLVAVDAHQVQQVLVNLVTNAHHALREVGEGRRLTITLRADAARGVVRLAVTDNGPGMLPEVQQRLFEPFFTTKPVGTGTGLGLSICRGIVEAHGGTIEAVSRPGEGATFTVFLPIEADATTAAPAPPAAAPASCRALLVDDEPDVLSVLEDMLRADGHSVDTALSGQQALTKLGAGRYDVILSDIRMPGLDGPRFYRAAVALDPSLASRFVFVTGDTLSESTRAFLEESRALSLAKPFSRESTRAVLEKLGRAQGSGGTAPIRIA